MVLASVEAKLGRFLTRRVWGLRLTSGGWGRRICRGTIERDMERINTAILGAGNMGTAMAHGLAARGHRVVVWDYFPEVLADIRDHGENRRFLKGVRLHAGVGTAASPAEAVAKADLVVVSVPSAFVAGTLGPVVGGLGRGTVVLNVAKGFAPRGGRTVFSLVGELAGGRGCAHLAGPAIANEMARGVPAAVVVAAEEERVARRVAGWLEGGMFIPGTTTDVAGAVLGGILKNIYAILLGCLEGLGGGGRNVEAALLAAGAREMERIAVASGARGGTMRGMAGLGDLVATGFSRESHNRKLGLALGSGKTLAEARGVDGWLPEGARAAATVCALARAGGVAAPLAGWVRRMMGAGRPPTLEGLLRALRAALREAEESQGK